MGEDPHPRKAAGAGLQGAFPGLPRRSPGRVLTLPLHMPGPVAAAGVPCLRHAELPSGVPEGTAPHAQVLCAGGSSLPVTRASTRPPTPCMGLPSGKPEGATPACAGSLHVHETLPCRSPGQVLGPCKCRPWLALSRGARAARPPRTTGACTPLGVRAVAAGGLGASVPPGRSPPQRHGLPKGEPGCRPRGPPRSTGPGSSASPHTACGGQTA